MLMMTTTMVMVMVMLIPDLPLNRAAHFEFKPLTTHSPKTSTKQIDQKDTWTTFVRIIFLPQPNLIINPVTTKLVHSTLLKCKCVCLFLLPLCLPNRQTESCYSELLQIGGFNLWSFTCEQQLNRNLIITPSVGGEERRGKRERDCSHDDVPYTMGVGGHMYVT